MMYESIILGLLTTSALARPQHGHMHKRFHPSGTAFPPAPSGTGHPYPSGSHVPYPIGNGTLPFLNGTGSAVAPGPIETTATTENVVTVTVIPVRSSGIDVNNQAGATSAGAGTGAAGTAAAVCDASQSTLTVTTTEVVTLTVDPSAASSPAASASEEEEASSAEAVTASAPAQFFAPSAAASTAEAVTAAAAAAVSPSAASYEVAPAASSPATVQVAVQSSSTSAAASPSASSTSGSSSGSKRGLAYNDASLTQFWSDTSVSWAYNWAATSGGSVGSELEYVPMAWCTGSLSVSDWTTAATDAISSGSKNLLSFNEPDQPGQCNIDASAAAAGHQEYMNPLADKARIGSPAVTNGGGSMGLTYLSNFLSACAGNCKIDFLNIHWYGSGSGSEVVENFKSHINSAVSLAQQNNIPKIWVTEFALNDADETATASFLDEVLPFLDAEDTVERYAFFMCKEGSLVNGNAISSTVGAAYVA